MQACTFISKRFFLSILLLVVLTTTPALAQKGSEPGDDEIISGPFSEYGEFDSEEDEASDERFFQFGRFFGLGLSIGSTTATGNLGKIYFGGFPTAGLRLLYWFDFNFALQVEVANSKFNYNEEPDGPSDVNLFRTLLQLKWYPDTRNLSAPITFVAPHLILGGGFYRRTDNIGAGNNDDSDDATVSVNSLGFHGGLGFELTLKPKKTYLQLEALIHNVPFSDQFDTRLAASSGVPDMTGLFVTATMAVVWTW